MRKVVAVLTALLTALVFIPSATFALSPDPDPPVDPAGPIDLGDTVGSIRVSAQLVTLIVGAFVPLLAGFLTTWKSKHAGALMILLNIANSAIVTAILADGTAVFSQQMIVNIVPGVVGSLGAYYGILKPRGVTSSPVSVPGPKPGEVVMVPGMLNRYGIKP